MSVARALTIAGSDPSGGAGIQQDLKTFQALDVWGMAAITAATVQDTTAVHGWHAIPADVVAAQISAVADDIGVDAAKTGMLGDAVTVSAVAAAVARASIPALVVDPVLVATSGDALAAEDVREALREVLIPLATLVTPNVAEAEALSGMRIADVAGAIEAGRAIVALGARAVVVTGGHLGDTDAVDVLVDHEGYELFRARRVPGGDTHGSGCMFSAAITASLATAFPLKESVARAKRFVAAAIERTPKVGRGARPLGPVSGWDDAAS